MATTKNDASIALTLDAFSAHLNDLAGENLAFAVDVRRLAVLRRELALIEAAKAPLRDTLKELYASGRVAEFGGRVFKQIAPTPVTVKRSVPSALIKKREPRLWAAARVLSPYVSVKPVGLDEQVTQTRAELAVGTLPGFNDPRYPDQVAQAYLSFPKVAPIKDQVDVIASRLRAVAARFDWDGTAREFADGWKLALTQLKYDSDRLRDISPELWEKLAVQTQVGGVQRFYFGRPGVDDAEADEVDGD